MGMGCREQQWAHQHILHQLFAEVVINAVQHILREECI